MITIISSFYNNSNHIVPFYSSALKELKRIQDDYEFIFINDCSSDNTYEELKKISDVDKNVKVKNNSVNYGEQKSYASGLKEARGDYVFIIQSDLETDLKNIGIFYEEIMRSRSDMVYGVISKNNKIKRSLTSKIYFKLFNKFSDIVLPIDAVWFRVVTKNVVNKLNEFNEYNLHLAGVLHSLGLKTKEINVEKNKHKKSSYTLTTKLLLAIDGVTNFTSKPLEYLFVFAIFLVLTLFVAIISTLIYYFVVQPLPGWTSFMLVALSLNSILFFILSLIAIYISKIYSEVKRRPFTTTKD